MRTCTARDLERRSSSTHAWLKVELSAKGSFTHSSINLSHMAAERSVEEQHLLSVAYKNVVDSRRPVRRAIDSVKQKEKIASNEQQADHAREHAIELEAELQKIYDGILTLMDENLTPSASTGELKVSYCKMKDTDTEELQDHAAKTQDKLVDAVENAEVTEIKRAVFRALARLRAAPIREFEMIAKLECRGEDSLTHDSEIPQVQYIDKTVGVPVVTQDQVLTSQTVQKTVEIPQVQVLDRVIDAPVVVQSHAPQERTQERSVEETGVPVPHVMEKTIEVVKLSPQERDQNSTMEQLIDEPDPRIQEAEEHRDENEVNKAKVEAKNGLENHSATTRSTSIVEQMKSKFEVGHKKKNTRGCSCPEPVGQESVEKETWV